MLPLPSFLLTILNDHVDGGLVTDSRYLRIIFSKISILFIILVSISTTGIIYILSSEYGKSRAICLINDLLPPETDYHKLAMPIALFCRSIEFSLVISYLQMIITIIGMIALIKSKRILFILCFNFTIALILFGILFLGLIVIISVKKLVLKATFSLFLILYQDDEEFCSLIEPFLYCHQHSFGPLEEGKILFDSNLIQPKNGDIIESKCGKRSVEINENENDCIEYLAKFTLKYTWIAQLSFIYLLFLIIILIQFIRIFWYHGKGNNNISIWRHLIRKKDNDINENIIKENIEEIKEINDNNINESFVSEEYEMITIYLNDKAFSDNDSVDYL
uniref:Uncharacterized protein n=1 Tax=Parastrongyloides trichosuri TaxID=131310 RepID=A0A0N5A7A3_PARTI